MKLEKKRIILYVAYSFGFSWLIAGWIYLNGGLSGTTMLISFNAPNLMLLLFYMYGPTFGNILTRFSTREGREQLWLKARLDDWREWLTAWIGPAVLTIVGMALYFTLFPETFDPSLEVANQLLGQLEQQAGGEIGLNEESFIALQLFQAVLIAPLVNSIFTFGEEFGWRAYLLPKLRPLGDRSALVLTGAIWGVWHWPIIAMGYNYGMPGQPLPLLAMTWFTVVAGVFLGWLSIRTESVWPAVIGHSAINGIAGLGLLLVDQNTSNLLLGPAPIGAIASLPWVLLAGWILWRID